MVEKQKDKKPNPLFSLINALFVSKDYVYNITEETAKQNIFMVLRRLGIKYPIEANVFNDGKVNPIDVIHFWGDYLFCGYIPDWVRTSVKPKKINKNDITSADIKLYKTNNDITDKQFEDAMKFFPDELISEIKAERDFYKKINNSRTNEKETD